MIAVVGSFVEKSALRSKRIARATPPWARTEPTIRAQPSAFYAEKDQINATAGKIVVHVVDVWPLKGKTFRGLDVPWNLCITPGAKNVRKSNKLPDELLVA